MLIKALRASKAALVFGALSLSGMAIATPAQADGPVPIDYFAVLDHMTSVSISPDGKRVAYRIMPSKGGDHIVEVREVANLGKKPIRLGGGKTDIQRVSWMDNDHLWLDFRQQVRDKVIDTNQGVWSNLSGIADVSGRKPTIEKLRYVDMNLEARLLATEPNKVLVTTGKLTEKAQRDNGQGSGKSFSSYFTPDYYLMDIKTQRLTLKTKVGTAFDDYILDGDGNMRMATEIDMSNRTQVIHYRNPETKAWKEIARWPVISLDQSIIPLGIDPEDPNKVFVLANNGQDKAGVYLMDVRTGQIGEQIFRHPDVDVSGGVYATNPMKKGALAGFSYIEEGVRKVAWIDSEEKAFHDSVEAAFRGKEVRVGSRSVDGKTAIVRTQSGKDPGTYYILSSGKAQKLGSRNPLLKPDDLGEVSFIRYTSRDGKSIPAYLTTPPRGEAPYPLIVMPHGGPEVSEHIVYREWPQLLANNGYMVLQPGFRGTTGYGVEHAKGIFNDWGGKPQNDKDDGALHLIRQGLVDPERVAMFGWSYGGYAAMTASVRSPNIYQCAVAGAGVSDPQMANAEFSGGKLVRAQLDQSRKGGVSPRREAAKANIPIFVVHGDLDQRVKIKQSDVFVKELKRYNKDHKYLVLENSDHFSNTIPYEDAKIFYKELISYLKNDCGPGGL